MSLKEGGGSSSSYSRDSLAAAAAAAAAVENVVAERGGRGRRSGGGWDSLCLSSLSSHNVCSVFGLDVLSVGEGGRGRGREGEDGSGRRRQQQPTDQLPGQTHSACNVFRVASLRSVRPFMSISVLASLAPSPPRLLGLAQSVRRLTP